MSDISEIYNKPKYLPFLIYCREHHYKAMEDLARCPFHLLTKEPGFTPLLASRVKAVYITFCKAGKNTDNMQGQTGECPEPEQPKAAVKAPVLPKTLSEPELVILLHAYFEKNGDRLISIDDACKAAGGRAKRAEIAKILQNVAWCRIVDKGTFFYAPIN
ncbi:hypothetical protein [Marasmitruncus massiliensis]|uniref:hypothetical protein n=1 Tax=Marasmitruncus massiliensis TaxID=1944642 RepID=UPI000C7C9D13|nr:hypothetical protein [Marasmitruncus massiliensis]